MTTAKADEEHADAPCSQKRVAECTAACTTDIWSWSEGGVPVKSKLVQFPHRACFNSWPKGIDVLFHHLILKDTFQCLDS